MTASEVHRSRPGGRGLLTGRLALLGDTLPAVRGHEAHALAEVPHGGSFDNTPLPLGGAGLAGLLALHPGLECEAATVWN